MRLEEANEVSDGVPEAGDGTLSEPALVGLEFGDSLLDQV